MLNFGGANHWIQPLTFVCQSCALDLQPRQLPSATRMIKQTSNAQGYILPSNDVQGSYCKSKQISSSLLFETFCFKTLWNDMKCIKIQHQIDNIVRPSPGSPTLEFSTSVGTNAQWRPFARLGSPVKVDCPCGSRQPHNLMAWHLIGSRNWPSSWRQGVTSPSQVDSPMTICPQPQAQGRKRGLGENPNQDRYNLTIYNSPVSMKIMLCCSQVCWCLLETGMLILHPKQNDSRFSWFKTSS